MTTTASTDIVPSRSFRRGFQDLAVGLRERELWLHLGWQDIKQRYRRSVIGPLWITISMATLAFALAMINRVLFGGQVATLLPNVTAGLIIWTFISNCILEGSDCFISNEGLIKQLPAPLSVHVLRTVWRQTLFMAHNMLVYVLIVGIFFYSLSEPYKVIDVPGAVLHPGLNWSILLIIPAFVVLAANGVWVALLFGIVATRFRDIPPVIGSLIQLLFYATPIMWPIDQIYSKIHDGQVQWNPISLNPVWHFIEIMREPMLGQVIDWRHWAAVGVMTVLGWGLALVAMKNYRGRVAYWV